MRIALFPSAFHPHVGGVEELCRQLAHQYRHMGHDPVIVTNRWPKDLPEEEIFEGLEVRRFNFRVPERHLRHFGGAILYGPGAARALCRYLRQRQIEILHVQCVSSNAHYALKAQRRLGLPLVVTLQGELTMDAAQIFQRSAFARGLMIRALSRADVITGCSAKTLADAEGYCGNRFGDNARVIFNGAAVNDFNAAEPYVHPRAYILGMGRIVPQKGFDVLIRAYAKAELTEVDLLIAGDGPERSALERLSAGLGVSSRIHFIGRADRTLTVKLFKGCLFFILPSTSDEGLPVVCAEAMAAGKAVIATRSGGTIEAILHGQNGIIIEKDDIGALAANMRRLAGDVEQRAHMEQAAAKRAKLFSWDVVAQQYMDAYDVARGAPLVRQG